MRFIVVGLNEQGLQRQKIVGENCVAITSNIQDIPLDTYDAALICVDNEIKYAVARYALSNNKHVMLNSPLWAANLGQIDELEQIAINNNRIFYIAYNLRFAPVFMQIQQQLERRELGEIYHCRLSFAARPENTCNGALIDLSPQLLNLLSFWFGPEIMQHNFGIVHKDRFGRHVIFADFNARCTLEVEANLFAARNLITAHIYGARDSVIVEYAYDAEQQENLAKLEYAQFNTLLQQSYPFHDCLLDKWIYAELERLGCEEMLLA